VIGYFESRPDQPVDLYQGTFEFREGADVLSVKGTVLLQWLPQPKLVFRADRLASTKLLTEMLEADLSAVGPWGKCRLERAKNLGAGMMTYYDQDTSAVLVRIDIDLGMFECVSNDSLDQVVFHVANFTGSHRRENPRTFSTSGLSHFVLQSHGWKIELREERNSSRRPREEEFVGFAFTHSGCLKRDDGRLFTTTEAADVLDGLYYFLSFARGRWCWPALFIGSNGSQFCWLSCSEPREIDQFTDKNFIPPFTNSEVALTQAFDGFLSLWNDSEWRRPLKTALTWYVEANEARSIESAIVAGQTALELIAWMHIVEREKTLSADGFDKLPASDRLKLMFKFLSIPIDFPSEVAALQAYSTHRERKWEDGARAVSELRNSIVHPKRRNALYHAPGSVQQQARALTLWYLSCAILRLFGYAGELPGI
jgi:hypothetical protein